MTISLEDFTQFTIRDIQQGLLARRFSAVEIATIALSLAEKQDPTFNVYITYSPERAIAAAEKVDGAIAHGLELGPLAGVPIAIKDVIVTKDLRTTCGSKVLSNYVPPYDATVVRRIEQAGGLIIGKTNCDEFAMGSSTENSAYGPVRNPYDTTRVPGGSSGGSAAAVALGSCVAALGSDTGGSVRQPAAFCGVVGITPTYGRVSRFGLVAYASSFDHVGPFARNVEDAGLLMEVIAGCDPLDSTSASIPVPSYAAEAAGGIAGMRVGLPQQYFEQLDGETREALMRSIRLLQNAGCEIIDISLPHTKYAVSCYYIICTAEASSNLARYDGIRFGPRAGAETLSDTYRQTRKQNFGDECKRRIILGTYVLSAGYYDAYYVKAQKVRRLITQDFQDAFCSVDALIAPVSPFPAFKLGEKVDDPLQMYLADIYTVTGDLAGIPCMSIPCGKTTTGLPIGLQIMANHFGEPTMLRLASGLERALSEEG